MSTSPTEPTHTDDNIEKLTTPTVTYENGFLKISDLDTNITDLKIYKDGQLYATIPAVSSDRGAPMLQYNANSNILSIYPANADDESVDVYVDGELVTSVEVAADVTDHNGGSSSQPK